MGQDGFGQRGHEEGGRAHRTSRQDRGRFGRRGFLTMGAAALAGGLPLARLSAQEGGAARLRVLSEGAANSFDSFSPGLNRNAIQVSWNVYDRLVRFAYRPRAEGGAIWDYFDIRPELAEAWEIAPDGRSLTFHLRRDARFHDGSPVTAADVKWSLDRIVASPIGLAQFRTGSMTDPAQFQVLDPHTFRIELPQPDRLALPNLALTYPIIVNARLAQQHATPDDPFAGEWLRTNPAGGGPFRIARAQMGEQILFERFEDWRSGPRPALQQVLWQTVPAAESRVAALIRGDADLVQDLPPRDVAGLSARPGVRVEGAPTSGFQFIAMNTQEPPFDDVNVRRAIAHALPYRAMFEAALFRRGEPLFGPLPPEPAAGEVPRFPQPMGYDTDLAAARTRLAASGHAQGFRTSFTYELSQATVAEPVALLLQEALAPLGIEVRIDKVPAGQMGTLLQQKRLPFYFESSIAFLADPDYFFRIFYSGETRWNFGSYAEPEFEALVAASRFETDPARYAAQVRRMIALAQRDLPLILLWHPFLDVGLRAGVEGYATAFHRQLDLRPLARAD